MSLKIKSPYARVPLRFGIVGGIVSIALFIVLYLWDKNPLVTNRIADVFIIPVFLFFAIKEFKDYYNQRKLRFWQGMSIGILTYLIIALLSAVCVYIIVFFIDTALFHDFVAARVAELVEKKEVLTEQLGADAYQSVLTETQNMKKSHIPIDDFLKKSIIGLFLTIIFSIILRK